ncbi:thiol peroxidase, Bcp-type [alpha proteobacterium U9-1i]|nr:thiol peroxidase, Bcp-type [alpha proteobacterium U9-1i]
MIDIAPRNAPAAVAPPLTAGDPAPWFIAPSDANERFQLSTVGGRRVLVSFLPSLSSGEGKLIVDQLLAGAGRFSKNTAGMLIFSADANDRGLSVPPDVSGVRFLYDPELVVAKLYGVTDEGNLRPTTFLINERLRIVAVSPVRTAEGHAAIVYDLYDRFGPMEPSSRAHPQAPVLIVPNVFEPAFCKTLIDGYVEHGGQESGFMVERDGKTVLEHDHAHKRRSDWVLTDQRLIDAARYRIRRRIGPEIQRAYQFHVSRIERYLVACYEAEADGHFSPHRDNTTRGTAHRRFAVSINLNDDYDGGDLVFPEFGRVHFRPPPGGACVFSCSLLHEATKVVRGTRYVFVPFLYDEAAKLVRDENLGSLA